MRIGELARRGGTTTRALRYYEEQGLLQPSRMNNGYRDYDDAALLRVQQIRALIDAGFNSQTIVRLLPCAQGTPPRIELCPIVEVAMRATLDRIESKLVALTDQRVAVAALLGTGDAG